LAGINEEGLILLIKKLEMELDMLERHLLILKFVIREEPIGIMKLAEMTGLPKHKVRYSLRVLEHEGLIGPSMHGAVSTEKTKKFVEGLDARIDALGHKFDEIKKLGKEI
jgi:predicted transcriptional regulator